MNSSANVLQVYKELAECYERRGQAQMRDRFLVLAADAALSGGQGDEAERLRQRLLQVNPHHMLKPYTTFDQARAAPDVDTYVRNLRLNYPLEVASDLLRALQASDDPNEQQLQQTAPSPLPSYREEPTLNLDADRDRSSWKSADDIEGTLALPPAEPPAPARPVRKTIDISETAALPFPPAPRPRVPTRTEPEQTQAPSRPAAARPAPRSAAPSKPAAPPRPPAPKAPPRPAPGPSPFAAFPNEEKPTAAPRRLAPEDNPEEGGGWLASALLMLVVFLGVTVAAYTIARPFLQ